MILHENSSRLGILAFAWQHYKLGAKYDPADSIDISDNHKLITSSKYNQIFVNRCYTQHALRPYIDSEINHIRHFIKIPFINKGIDFIDLPSIFRDNTVESSITNYFENKETPIICYKYNKPIRSTIFNFNKLVAYFDIDRKTPDS